MQRKLLLAGPIVMILIAIVIVILSSITSKERPLVQNQQEIPKESNETFIRSVPTVSSPQPKQANEAPEPSEEEWEEFETLLRSLEESEEEAEGIQQEVASEPETHEAESSEARISPELEALFIGVKQFIDEERAIDTEALPFLDEHFKLKRRQIEIGLHDLVEARGEEAKRLHEEFRRNKERMETLMAIIAPFGERMRQLRNEFEQKYGMTLEEFFKKYDADYRVWKAGL